jgi:protein transport protein SEC61 subunit gamma-like protein
MQEEVTFKQKASRFITQCVRVLKVTRKPDKTEYTMLVKISGLGIIIIGLIGFIIHMTFIVLKS